MFPIPSFALALLALVVADSGRITLGTRPSSTPVVSVAAVPVLTGLVDGYVRKIVGTSYLPAVGATVTLTKTNGQQVHATTNAQGYFRVTVTAGTYASSAVLGSLSGTSYSVSIAPPLATSARVNINIQ